MVKLKLSVPKKYGQRLARRTAEAAVRGWVFGVIRRDHYSYPVGIRLRLRVAVGVSGADRSHRPPEVVKELRVPAGDQSVAAARL